jgi:hypothetical protein
MNLARGRKASGRIKFIGANARESSIWWQAIWSARLLSQLLGGASSGNHITGRINHVTSRHMRGSHRVSNGSVLLHGTLGHLARHHESATQTSNNRGHHFHLGSWRLIGIGFSVLGIHAAS